LAVILICSGSFCNGDRIAEAVTEKMGYRQINTQLLETASELHGISTEKLQRVLDGSPQLFKKPSQDLRKNIASIEITLAELVQQDNVVYHGFAGHLVPKDITHALRVCLIATREHRIEMAMKEAGLSEKEAIKLINKDDEERENWTQFLLSHEPYDKHLYDILIPMHSTDPDEAVSIICEKSQMEAINTTPESTKASVDFLLAAQVQIALAEEGHDVSVSSEDGNISIAINKYVVRLEHLQKQLETSAAKIQGVKSVSSAPGTKFVPPALIRMPEFSLPKKALLVDDEREFVQTLSERLLTRDLDTSVVYDGEEALGYLKNDVPDVMVLDLKMPGIDGIEVLRQVKQHHPKVEVIILTGHGSENEEAIAKELGAFAYLQKPVDIEILAQTMREAYKKVGKVEPDAEE